MPGFRHCSIKTCTKDTPEQVNDLCHYLILLYGMPFAQQKLISDELSKRYKYKQSDPTFQDRFYGDSPSFLME